RDRRSCAGASRRAAGNRQLLSRCLRNFMRRLPLDYAVRNLGRSLSRLSLIVLGSALLVLIILAAAAFVRGMDQSLRATGSEHNIILLGTGSEESVQRSEVGMGVAGIAAASVFGIRELAG